MSRNGKQLILGVFNDVVLTTEVVYFSGKMGRRLWWVTLWRLGRK